MELHVYSFFVNCAKIFFINRHHRVKLSDLIVFVQTELEGTVEQISIKIDEKTNGKQNEKEIEKILDNTVSRKTWETSSFEGVCVLCSMYSSFYQ
jgi:phage terminase large subunit-like protein